MNDQIQFLQRGLDVFGKRCGTSLEGLYKHLSGKKNTHTNTHTNKQTKNKKIEKLKDENLLFYLNFI